MLLLVGARRRPGCPRGPACRSPATISSSDGARPTMCRPAPTPPSSTTAWSRASTRASCAAPGGYELDDLGSKNGTWLDNPRVDGERRKVRLRDGALLFFGNHVAIFRMVSPLELEAIKAELVTPLGPVATASPTLAVACDRLRRLAASDGELLILGETGAGKEVYARAVHRPSGRKGRFVAINCAAIPRELVESELFGYRQGAHSTAHQAKPGLIEEAEGGTLFLDEIGEMTPEAQIKLLRFLQDRELTPLGSTRPRQMDVRIIAATNRTPGPGKGPSGLRDDIVGRLGAAPMHLPPLRSRVEDLGVLTAHFLRASSSARVRAAGLPRAGAARLAAQRARAREDRLHGGRAAGGRQAHRAARSARADRARAVGAAAQRRRAPPPDRRRRRRRSRSRCAATTATWPTSRASSASTAPPSGAGSRSSASTRRSSAEANSRAGAR